jgi:hypothetical protein
MKMKDITYEQVKDAVKSFNGELAYIDRYVNRNGIKFYLLKTTEVKKHDYGREKYINFIAWPRYYYPTSMETPRLAMTFGVDSSSLWMFKNDQIAEEYLNKYGYVEFIKWLNEINEPKTTEGKVIIDSHTKDNEPIFRNEKLEAPKNQEDEDRLLRIAIESILDEFNRNKGRGPVDNQFLLDTCFVPEDIFNYALTLLWDKGYVNLANGSLTLEGLSFMKNRESEGTPSNVYSQTVFVAQAFNDELNVIFDSIYAPSVRTFHLNPIKIDETDHNEPIDVEILNQIRQCRFMICDLTYARPSVYFEAGYALARGIKVMFTARIDHNSDAPGFDASKLKIHFDLRNRQISWWDNSKIDDFKAELSTRISRFLEWQTASKEGRP